MRHQQLAEIDRLGFLRDPELDASPESEFSLTALQTSFAYGSPPRRLNDLDYTDILDRDAPFSVEDMLNVHLPQPYFETTTPEVDLAASPATALAENSHREPFDLEPLPSPTPAEPMMAPSSTERGRVAFNWDCIPNLSRRMKIFRWKSKKISITQGLSNPKKYPKRQDYAQTRPRRNGRFVSANSAA